MDLQRHRAVSRSHLRSPVEAGRQRRRVEGYASLAAGAADLGEKGQDTAVPQSQFVGVEGDLRGRRLPPQFGFQATCGGEPVPQFPSPGETNQKNIVLDPVKREVVQLRSPCRPAFSHRREPDGGPAPE
jgi:hypothetical protein